MKRFILALVLSVYLLGLGFTVSNIISDSDTLAVNWNSRHAPHGNGNGNGNGNGGGNGKG